ncbi:MAG: hypothetical protein WKF87_10220 [Chryseolinea sp.]
MPDLIISSDNAVALAALTDGAVSMLYQIDLAIGKAVALGNLSSSIIGLAIPSTPCGLLRRRCQQSSDINFLSFGTQVSKVITGLSVYQTESQFWELK